MVAVTKAYLADLTGALVMCESALEASRSSGDRRAELLAGSVASSVHTMRAQYRPAVTRGLRGVELARALGTRRFEAENLGLLGLARLGLGEHELALATLEQAASLAREACPTYCGPWAFVALAQALQHEERWARALLDEGEALLGRGCVSHNHLEFRHHAMVLLAAWQDWTGVARQADALEHYTRHEPLPWAELTIAAHRALCTFAMSPRERARPALVDALERVRAVQFLELAPPLERALATFD
jgi:tetratricopeptide (TPR) repeat protein